MPLVYLMDPSLELVLVASSVEEQEHMALKAHRRAAPSWELGGRRLGQPRELASRVEPLALEELVELSKVPEVHHLVATSLLKVSLQDLS